MSEPILAYKRFNQDLTCRGFQYEVGETYTQDRPAELCSTGFHAVQQPINVLAYYPPNKSVYHEVELVDVVGPDADGDSKVAGREIKIGARIELPALIKAQIDFVFKNAKKPAKGGVSKAKNGLATAEIDNGAATASGRSGAATASGRSGAATASGESGAATASGEYGAATASGRSGAATASGWYGAATASGEKSVALASGYNGRARGVLGTALFLTERDEEWTIVAAEAVIVDGKNIEPDVYYTLRGGKVVKA
jgi:hypothetical protein